MCYFIYVYQKLFQNDVFSELFFLLSYIDIFFICYVVYHDI